MIFHRSKEFGKLFGQALGQIYPWRIERLFKGFKGIEDGFDILLRDNFGNVVYSALDVGKRNES
jgi:hypothetical protein